MVPTLIGLIVVLVGFVLLFRGSIEAMLAFTMVCTLMGGSAALILTALGSSSIAPANVAMGFLLLRVALPGSGAMNDLRSSFRANAIYLIYAAWAVVSAAIMPLIFKGQIDVVPLRPGGLRNLYDSFPLAFSNQNITAPVYIVGSSLLAISAFVAARQKRGAVVFAKAAALVAGLHAAFGLADVLLPDAIWSVVTRFFRNGSYAQLNQSVGGFERIAGIMPEASSYAGYGFPWFVLMAELWLRDVLPRRTGLIALVLAGVLIFSTSSTAYASLAVYAALLAVRMVLFPLAFPVRKPILIVGVIIACAVATSSLVLINPHLAENMLAVLRRLTIDKADSSSGLQRTFWARQGYDAFATSFGLGIGAGSFRSSNILTAVLGSMGVIGVVTALIYVGQMFLPLRKSTYLVSENAVQSVGTAASWAALCAIIPGILAAPSPDPGATFSLFAGVALALRLRARHGSFPPLAEALNDPVAAGGLLGGCSARSSGRNMMS